MAGETADDSDVGMFGFSSTRRCWRSAEIEEVEGW
jgi:hypothetical protein